MIKKITKTADKLFPVEMDKADKVTTDKLLQEANKALCQLSTHYTHLNSTKQYDVNKLLHKLWEL